MNKDQNVSIIIRKYLGFSFHFSLDLLFILCKWMYVACSPKHIVYYLGCDSTGEFMKEDPL